MSCWLRRRLPPPRAGGSRATGYLPSWLPLMPDWHVTLSATAVKEPFSAPATTVIGSEGALR